jgi:pimeloyl-ACP methyl ester carboxylesterase
MAAGIAGLHAAAYPARGIVMVDQTMEVQPFVTLLHQVAPMLRGPGFTQVWQKFEDSLGLDRIPEPTRTLVLDSHKVEQDVVLGYWEQPLTTDPAELQAWIDGSTAQLRVPSLVVLGREVTAGERERLAHLPDARTEEWVGDGRFVHLVDPDRFAARLLRFVEHCDETKD